jgi:hypothetical protein
MEIDVEIEQIDNGFIVTGNDSTKGKEYFPTIEKFLESRLLEQVRELDTQLKQHEPSNKFSFQLKSDL